MIIMRVITIRLSAACATGKSRRRSAQREAINSVIYLVQHKSPFSVVSDRAQLYGKLST